MAIVNVTLSIDLSLHFEDDADDIAQEITDMAVRRFPANVKRVEQIERDMPRTYGDLFRAEGYDPDA